MSIDLNKRLDALKTRRTEYSTVAKALGIPTFDESYERRSANSATRYALGAMQEVDKKYTDTCFNEGQRVIDQLRSGLTIASIPATFEYQGSVPLNVHIRGVSDVDVLVLHDGFITVDSSGPRSTAGYYRTLAGTVIDDMMLLRRKCEKILSDEFPAATVDKSGSKSISISGGSLRRKIDVVPAHWRDTAEYQASLQKHDREVRILDTSVPELKSNRPFMHMKKVNDKDLDTHGGAKKVIRLLKNLKADSDSAISLSSYDIASLVWYMPSERLRLNTWQEISLVGVALDFLKVLSGDRKLAESLITPDLSRTIIDSPDKFRSLQQLTSDLEELAIEIAREADPYFGPLGRSVTDVLRQVNV